MADLEISSKFEVFDSPLELDPEDQKLLVLAEKHVTLPTPSILSFWLVQPCFLITAKLFVVTTRKTQPTLRVCVLKG